MRQRIVFSLCVAALVAWTASPWVLAQNEAKLPIELLEPLADKAAECVEVTLDESLLKLAAAFLNDKSPDEAKAKAAVSDLKGVYVRVFEFDAAGMYSEDDLRPLREKLKAPGWSKIVNIRTRRHEQQDVQVTLLNQGGKVKGMVILATGPTNLTVVNIIGSIDLEKLRELEGEFGIPKLELERGEKPKSKEQKP
jgi:hypothetical protein